MEQQPAPAHRPRRGLILTIAGWSVLGIAVLGIAWIVVTGLLARQQLDRVRAELPELHSALATGDLSRAQSLASSIETQARRAHALTSGPAWWTASNLPWLGSPLKTSRVVSSAADRVGRDVLPGVVQLAGQLDDTTHQASTSVDLDQIARFAPTLDHAARAAHAASLQVQQASGSWLGYVSSARTSVAGQLSKLDGELSGADRAVRIMLPMLGENGPKTYFIGFLNEAEVRGLGGIPGAFAIATADHGHVRFDQFGTDADLKGVRANVSLGTDFAARYAADDPTGTIQNSDMSPDFRYAAQIWAGMWEAKTGRHIDGAIAIDPTALSYLLKVTGPAQLPGGGVVSAANVVALTQQRQYAKFGANTPRGNRERKAYLVSLAKAVSGRLTKASAHPEAAVRALSRAARERRLVVWSADPAVEAQLETADWAGALVARADAFTGFVVNNGSGGKIDYYVDRTLTYRRTSCAAGGTAVATFTLTNTAPRSGLPSYVTTRLDKAPHGAKPGSEALLVTYYATPGAQVTSVTINGVPIIVATAPENGLVTATVRVELPPGGSSTVQVHVAEPKPAGSLQVLRQPGVRPLAVHVANSTCGTAPVRS